MASLGRETSRVRSRDSTASNSRPSLMSRAYNSVSMRGAKSGAAFKQQLQRHSSKDASSQDTAVNNPDLHGFDGVFTAPAPGCRPKPPAKLSTEQESKLAELLTYFRQKKTYPTALKHGSPEEPPSDWEKLRMLSRESMLRYLRACKWDSNQAKKRLTDTIAWRREFGVDDIKPDEVEEEAKCGKETVMGFDNFARPLHYMHPHRNNTKESPRQMRFAVWILEACIDVMPPGVEQLALLINFDSKSRNPTSISNAKLMLYILQNHYVERLGVALCINVPWVFKAFWNAIQSFIDPVTKSKCKFDEGITDVVPPSHLSAEYGGKVDPTYKHDAYWPELVKLTQQRRAEMLKRFKEQWNSEIGASEWVIRGGNDAEHKAPMDSKDVAAIASEAEDKTALGRTQDNEPAEAPTTQVSDPKDEPGSSGGAAAAAAAAPKDPSSARKEAVDASHNRAGSANASESTGMVLANGHHDDTAAELTRESSIVPDEAFKTPLDTLNKSPLDRHFSRLSTNASVIPAGAGVAGLAMAETQKPETAQEEPSAATATAQPNGDGPSGAPSSSAAAADDLHGQQQQQHPHGFRATMARVFHHDTTPRRSTDQPEGSVEKSSKTGGEASSSSSSDSIKVLFFAAARDAAGKSEATIPLSASGGKLYHLSDLPQLLKDHGSIKDGEKFSRVAAQSKWSVDQTMIDDEEEIKRFQLKAGQEIAIIPPVSGG